MSGEEVRPDRVRINFHVDRELNNRLDAKVPHGMKASALRVTFTLIADFLDKCGDVGLGALLAGHVELHVRRDNVPPT